MQPPLRFLLSFMLAVGVAVGGVLSFQAPTTLAAGSERIVRGDDPPAPQPPSPPAVQPKAVIDGPAQASPGDLVVLDASRSTASDRKWLLVESAKTFLPVDGGSRCVFASGSPGKYTFVLSVALSDRVDVTTWTLNIGDDPDPPAPDPPKPGPNPPNPTPVPVPPTPTPVPPTPTKLFAVVFRETEQATPAEGALLTSRTLLEQLAAKGHILRIFDVSGSIDEDLGYRSVLDRVGVPALILQNPAGDVLNAVKLPATEAAFLEEVGKAGG